ncbi:MAG: phosphoribosylformylglycinamidine synthase subunit PurL, partial [Bacteroidota bacterium]
GKKLLQSAHDISEGGLFISLLESAFVNQLGFEVDQQNKSIRSDAYWFGESQSRVAVSVAPQHQQEFESIVSASSVGFEFLGKVNKGSLSVNGQNWGSIQEWMNAYDNAIGAQMS